MSTRKKKGAVGAMINPIHAGESAIKRKLARKALAIRIVTILLLLTMILGTLAILGLGPRSHSPLL